MVIRLGLILFVCAGLLISCGGDESTATEESTTAQPESQPAPSGAKQDATQPSSGAANTVEQLPWTFLTNGIFHNNATITSGQNPGNNPNKGAWLDFKENGTYEYGTYSEKKYTGSWFYDGDKEILELNPEGEERPSEWQVKHKDASLIWIGTNKYGDNATQMRWLRRTGYPEAPGN